MGYFDSTIKDLDRVIDRGDAIAKTLAVSSHTDEACVLREGIAKVREVRDGLVCRQYDIDRSRDTTPSERLGTKFA